MTRGKPRENPLDGDLRMVIQGMKAEAAAIDRMAEGVPDFDSARLSPGEEELAYANPAGVFFPDAVSEATGLPVTNAEASAMLLQKWGAAKYVRWVEDNERRRLREGLA